MSKIWREEKDSQKHKDFMTHYDIGGTPITRGKDNLIADWVYFAEVEGFVFQFTNLEQVKECKRYFEQKIHFSTKGYHPPYEHYWQPWYCRLPKGIVKRNKRKKVLRVLNKILEKWDNHN